MSRSKAWTIFFCENAQL